MSFAAQINAAKQHHTDTLANQRAAETRRQKANEQRRKDLNEQHLKAMREKEEKRDAGAKAALPGLVAEIKRKILAISQEHILASIKKYGKERGGQFTITTEPFWDLFRYRYASEYEREQPAAQAYYQTVLNALGTVNFHGKKLKPGKHMTFRAEWKNCDADRLSYMRVNVDFALD